MLPNQTARWTSKLNSNPVRHFPERTLNRTEHFLFPSHSTFAIWTKNYSASTPSGLSPSVPYTIIYLGVFLNQYRTAFFIFLGLITITVFLYWFRDGGNKAGWESLDDSILIVLFLSLTMAILMIIGCVLASKIDNYSPEVFGSFRATIHFAYRISPIIITLINLVNFIVFIARN